ncbi:MAG: protoheme IX farnesyltransferase [Bacteroidales bacterium]|nr:protoheme IX farnesyltransferase [Bacteroidales bacterium]
MEKKNKPDSFLKVISQLGKVRISIPVAFTTLTGYILSHGSFDRGIVLPVLGIFLLASGASALNQIQEMEIDLRMKRTSNRPLPGGRISLTGAWIVTLGFFISGSLALILGPGWLTFLVGFATFIWYNAIYTPLKRITAFAAVPGSVVGALPPLAGWVAGGGLLADEKAYLLGFFFFIGQIPHFWLLLLKFGEQYEDASLPSMTKLLSKIQIKRLTFIWIAAMAVVAFALPVYRVIFLQWTSYSVMGLSVLLVAYFIPLLRNSHEFKVGRSFVLINLYYLLVMLIMISDRLF